MGRRSVTLYGGFFSVLEGVPALERRTSRTGWREGTL